MKKLILLLLFIPLVSFGQIKNAENNLESNEKIKYYNKDWISVNKSKAKYYRIYSIDSDGKISNVRDYFSNGNIQGTADGALFISDNDKFTKWTGNVKIYNEKGRLTYSYYNPLFDWEDEISIKEYFDKKNSKNLEGIWELSTRNGNIKIMVYYNELLKKYNFISLPPFQGALSGSIESSSREGLFTFILGNNLMRTPAVVITDNVYKINFGLQGRKHSPNSKIQSEFFYNSDESTLYKTYPKSNNSLSKKNIKKGEWAGNGSGVIISKSGYIITNHHVIEDADEIEVEFILNDEVQKFNAEIVQVDKTNDLAILKIFDMNFDGVEELPYNFKTRSSDVGTKVYAFGYPMALSIMGKEMKVTDGMISSKTGFDGNITTYQITAPIQGGNSGGPLFDEKGNLIGINSSGIRKDIADNVAYSIKTSYVLNLIDILPKSIELPSNTKLESLPLTEQIKEISKYVVLIKVK